MSRPQRPKMRDQNVGEGATKMKKRALQPFTFLVTNTFLTRTPSIVIDSLGLRDFYNFMRTILEARAIAVDVVHRSTAAFTNVHVCVGSIVGAKGAK